VDVRHFFARLAKADFADAIGVAVSDNHVSVAHLRKRVNHVEVLDFRTREIDAPPEGVWPLIVDFVRDFAGGGDVPEGCRVGVVLDRRNALLAHLQLPSAAAENLERVVAYEADRILPVPADELYTTQYARPMGSVGERISVTVVASRKTSVEDAQQAFSDAGLSPSAVSAFPVALADYYHFCRGEQSGAAGIFHREEDRESMTVVSDGMLVSSVRFDPAVEGRSDRLRRELETLLPDRADDVAEMIIDEEAAEGDVNLASLAPHGMLPSGRKPTWREAAAIGAALAQLNESRVKVNLLPPELIKTEDGVGLRELALSALVVVMSVSLAGMIALKNLSTGNAMAAEVERLLPKVSAVTQKEEANRALAAKLSTLEDARAVSVLAYLRDITIRLPNSAYLTTFRFKGDRIEIDGIADSAAGLISLLEQSPNFANVEFTAPTTKYLQDQQRFSLRMGFEQ
jgi:general secretion pathway protein L